MKNMIVVAVICLAVGAVVGKFYLSSPKVEGADSAQADSLKNKLQELTDSDIAEYYRLRTLEEKYKKADEIFAKIMQIFLVDLGLRVSKVDAAKAESGPVLISKKETDKTSTDHKNDFQPQERVATTTVVKPPRAWLAAESALSSVRGDRDIADFLDKAKIANFDDEIKSGHAYANANNNIDFLNGEFLGLAEVVVNGRPSTWGVMLRISMQMENGIPKGSTHFRLRERGKVFSDSRGNGDIKDLREFAAGSSAILLRVAPTTYFQLYALSDRTTLVGNVYKRPSEELPYTHIGNVRLRKN